jgi:hypothetical protein
MKYFRYPYGLCFNNVDSVLFRLNLITVPWTLNFEDNKNIRSVIIENMNKTYINEIVLIHSTEYWNENLIILINELKKYGEFIKLSNKFELNYK